MMAQPIGSAGLRCCYRIGFTKDRLRKRRSYQDGALLALQGQGQVLSTWGEVIATVRLPDHWDSLRPGEEIEDLRVALRIVNSVKEEDIWSGEAFQTGGTGGGRSDPEELIVNEAAVQSHSEGPVILEAFVAKKLRPHQREGVRFMFDAVSKNRGCILADTMGLGKSLQALALLWVVLSNNLVHKAVIVCPSSLCANWRAEVKKWLGEKRLKPTVVESGKEKTELQIREFRDFGSRKLLIVSYDQLRRHVQLVDPVCELLICDEGHRLRCQGTATTKTLGQMQCQRRILLSGTPLQNDLEELFHCGKFVRPDLFARGQMSMAPKAAAQVVQRAREPLASLEEKALGQQVTRELEQKTSQFLLRRTMENVSFAMPPRTEVVLRLRLAPTQVAAYQALLADLHSGPPVMAKALKAMMALRLLCNDPADLLQDGSDKKKGKSNEDGGHDVENQLAPELVKQMLQAASGLSAKSLVLLALLQHWRQHAPTDRVVVVSNFSRSLRRLSRLVPLKSALLAGDTAPAKRQAAVEGLNTPGADGTDVLLLSSKAGGTGLNLIGANRLILFDPDWNPANDAQAMARIWREGQTKPCFIYRFVLAGTLEEKICQRQQVKTDLAQITVDGQDMDAAGASRLSWDELRRVFALEGYDSHGVPERHMRCADVPAFGPRCTADALPEGALLGAPELEKALLGVHLVSHRDPAKDAQVDAPKLPEAPSRTAAPPAINQELPSASPAAFAAPAAPCALPSSGMPCMPATGMASMPAMPDGTARALAHGAAGASSPWLPAAAQLAAGVHRPSEDTLAAQVQEDRSDDDLPLTAMVASPKPAIEIGLKEEALASPESQPRPWWQPTGHMATPAFRTSSAAPPSAVMQKPGIVQLEDPKKLDQCNPLRPAVPVLPAAAHEAIDGDRDEGEEKRRSKRKRNVATPARMRGEVKKVATAESGSSSPVRPFLWC